MNHAASLATPALIAAMALAGLGLGWLYFLALYRSVRLLAAGNGLPRALLRTLSRIAAAVGVLSLAAKLGAAALLAMFGGFLLARTLALRARRETR